MEDKEKNEMKQIPYVVSFPHIGNYYAPVYNLLTHIVDPKVAKVQIPKKITDATMRKGAKSSPDFACVPFKYNMGNYIESLENGANVLIQAGGGCRYGYYYQVQEQILKDMGYKFTFVPLMEEKGVDVKGVYQKLKVLNPRLRFTTFVRYFLLAFRMIYLLDELESYMRIHYALQMDLPCFDHIQKELLAAMMVVNNMAELAKLKKRFKKQIHAVPLKKETKAQLKIGIVGELFTSMEPYSSFFIENKLSRMGCVVKRYTTVTYLLFQKEFAQKKVMKKTKQYLTYQLGADGAESIAHTLEMIEEGYDGIIHIKPFGCSPEINAMPMLQKISTEEQIPIMYLTFDEQTTATGVQTRLEAFYDMLEMKKQKEENIIESQSKEITTKSTVKQFIKSRLQIQN